MMRRHPSVQKGEEPKGRALANQLPAPGATWSTAAWSTTASPTAQTPVHIDQAQESSPLPEKRHCFHLPFSTYSWRDHNQF